ncbi:MAG: hypothetical protein AAFV85_28390, partial [Cyanobacteria bacterium J06634_6]
KAATYQIYGGFLALNALNKNRCVGKLVRGKYSWICVRVWRNRLVASHIETHPVAARHPCIGEHSQRRKATWGLTAPKRGFTSGYDV